MRGRWAKAEDDETLSSHDRLAAGLQKAFLDHGYEHLTMSTIASICGLTRRALYHHFSNKEEAFRFLLRHFNDLAVRASLEAGRDLLDGGADAVEILGTIMDVRYGETRRKLAQSPHAAEINDQAFRRALDIMIEVARTFQDELAGLLAEMEDDDLFRRKPETSLDELSQMLCDGARGVNQARPPIPPAELSERYRRICAAILFGCVDPPGFAPAPAATAGADPARAKQTT